MFVIITFVYLCKNIRCVYFIYSCQSKSPWRNCFNKFLLQKMHYKGNWKKCKQYEILVLLQQTSYPDYAAHFICLARQTEIQVAQLSTVRITQKGLLATQEKQPLHFQKLTTNLVLRILTIFLKYQAQEAMKQISVQSLFLTLGKPQIKNSIICG